MNDIEENQGYHDFRNVARRRSTVKGSLAAGPTPVPPNVGCSRRYKMLMSEVNASVVKGYADPGSFLKDRP